MYSTDTALYKRAYLFFIYVQSMNILLRQWHIQLRAELVCITSRVVPLCPFCAFTNNQAEVGCRVFERFLQLLQVTSSKLEDTARECQPHSIS